LELLMKVERFGYTRIERLAGDIAQALVNVR